MHLIALTTENWEWLIWVYLSITVNVAESGGARKLSYGAKLSKSNNKIYIFRNFCNTSYSFFYLIVCLIWVLAKVYKLSTFAFKEHAIPFVYQMLSLRLMPRLQTDLLIAFQFHTTSRRSDKYSTCWGMPNTVHYKLIIQ